MLFSLFILNTQGPKLKANHKGGALSLHVRCPPTSVVKGPVQSSYYQHRGSSGTGGPLSHVGLVLGINYPKNKH